MILLVLHKPLDSRGCCCTVVTIPGRIWRPGSTPRDKTILATYTHGEEDTVTSLLPETPEVEKEDNEEEEEEERKLGLANMKWTRPDIGGLLGNNDDNDNKPEKPSVVEKREKTIETATEEDKKKEADKKPMEMEGKEEDFVDNVSEMELKIIASGSMD